MAPENKDNSQVSSSFDQRTPAESQPTGPQEESPTSFDEPVVIPDTGETSQSEPITAHVLFMDIVDSTGYPTDVQPQMVKRLVEIVRGTDAYSNAFNKNQLLQIPTGDGMALVFFTATPLAPVHCAQQICSALRNQNASFTLRMGIHSGPVFRTEDIDKKPNVSGDGINIAHRVMECGDAGHIIVSSTVAAYLKPLKDWSGQLHDLKQVKVKKTQVHAFNLFKDQVGNRKIPRPVRAHRWRRQYKIAALALAASLAVAALIACYFFWLEPDSQPVQTVAILVSSDDPETTRISKGITSAIAKNLRSLSPNSDLDVQPDDNFLFEPSSVQPSADARKAGQFFKAQAVLWGQLKKLTENRYELTIKLVDMRNSDDKPIWPEKKYSLPPYGFQDVAIMISAELLKSLREHALPTPGEAAQPTTAPINDEAFKLYTEGRTLLALRTRNDIENSINAFKRAIEQEGSYAEAYAALAEAYNVSSGYGVVRTPLKSYQLAEEAVNKALELNDNLAEAHVAKGYLLANRDFKWAEAEQEFKRALEINPKSADAHYHYAFQYLIPVGRMDDAIREMKEAKRLSLDSLIISTNLGWTYYYARNDEEAFNQYQATLKIDPGFNRAHRRLMEFYEMKGDYAQALAHYARFGKPEDTKALMESLNKNEKAYWLKRLEISEASAKRGELVQKYDSAVIYAGLGQKQKALDFLEEAYRERSDGIIKIGVNRRFDLLRSEKRFTDLLQNMGIRLWPEKL